MRREPVMPTIQEKRTKGKKREREQNKPGIWKITKPFPSEKHFPAPSVQAGGHTESHLYRWVYNWFHFIP